MRTLFHGLEIPDHPSPGYHSERQITKAEVYSNGQSYQWLSPPFAVGADGGRFFLPPGEGGFLFRKPVHRLQIEIQSRLSSERQIGIRGGGTVIRAFREHDLDTVMQIWLHTNIKAHSFISKAYWENHYAPVKEMLPQAEVYVCEDDDTHQIMGFIGLTGSYIAGIFIREGARSRGMGKQLLDYAKGIKTGLSLSVYQKNVRAVSFYQREQFTIQSEGTDESTNEKEFTMSWSKSFPAVIRDGQLPVRSF